MKKQFLRVTALLVVFSMLICGCSKANNSNTSSTSDSANTTVAPESSSNAEEASGEPVTLKVWMKEFDGIDLETNLMTRELEKRLNVNLEFETFSSAEDTTTQFNLSIASGAYPDIYLTMWFSPDQINTCVENGVLIPLNDYINAGSNYASILEEYPAWKPMVTANDGNIYTFFYNDTGVHKASEYKMWYRAEWLENLGWSAPPTTPEEFKQYLIDIRDKDANGNGDPSDEIPLMGYYNGRKTDPICFLMNPFELYTDKYYYITDDKQVHFSAITDGWREGLKYIADLYKEGLIAEETYVQDQTTFKALLNRTGEEALIGTFPAWYNGAEIDTTVMSWFTYEALAPLKGNYQQTAARFGGNFNLNGAITTSCENPDVAFKFLDYMVGEEGTILTQWGVEGESYEWVDEPSYYGSDKSIKRLMNTLDTFWNTGSHPRLDTEYYRYSTTMSEEAMETDNTWVLLKAAKTYEPYYVNHNIPDIVWCDDTNLAQEISDLSSLINEYIKTTDTQFIMGALDINDDAAWQQYLDTLNDMGLQKYIEDLTIYYGLK